MQLSSQRPSLKKFVEANRRKFLLVLAFSVIIAIGLLASWFALKALLNTEYPVLPVSSSGMSVFQSDFDSLVHAFEPTLHVGDLIVVQGVDASNVGSEYPNSDILVFHFPQSDSTQSGGLVVARVVAEEERNGIVYFRTKGDGLGVDTWPEVPSVSECDQWRDYRENYTWNGMISEKLLVGKVVFRVPWIGYLVLFVQTTSGMLVVFVVTVAIVLVSMAFWRRRHVEPSRGDIPTR
jgi:hypothetical protein